MIEIPFESTIVASADTPTAAHVWREAAAFAQSVRGEVVFCLLDIDEQTTGRFANSDRGRLIGPSELRAAGKGYWADLLEQLAVKYAPSRFWVSRATGDDQLLTCVQAVGAPLVMPPRHFNALRPALAQKIRDLRVGGEPVAVLFVEEHGAVAAH